MSNEWFIRSFCCINAHLLECDACVAIMEKNVLVLRKMRAETFRDKPVMIQIVPHTRTQISHGCVWRESTTMGGKMVRIGESR